MADDDFKFPDEMETPEVETPAEEKIEIEIVDDRPEEDQKNSQPLPEEIVKDIENDDLEQYSKEAKQRLLQMKKLQNITFQCDGSIDCGPFAIVLFNSAGSLCTIRSNQSRPPILFTAY